MTFLCMSNMLHGVMPGRLNSRGAGLICSRKVMSLRSGLNLRHMHGGRQGLQGTPASIVTDKLCPTPTNPLSLTCRRCGDTQ